MSNQPYYTIKIGCTGCNFLLTVNDRKVYDFYNGENLNTELPVSSFLQNGANDLLCEIYPSQNLDQLSESANVTLSIVEGAIKSDLPAREIKKFSTPQFKSNSDTLPVTEFKLTGSFNSTILLNSRFNNGIALFPTEKLKEELFERYKDIYHLFKSKKINEVLELMKTKHLEIAQLTEITYNELVSDIKEDFESYAMDSSLELWEFKIEDLFLKIYNNGKLACLEVENGNQPICFINREERLAIYIEVFFYRNPVSKSLEIIR